MEMTMYIAAAAVFVPALVMFYYVLRDYTYPKVENPFFEDSKVFTLFAVGLIEGFFISWAYVNFFDKSNLFVGVIFALIQVLALLVVLNLRRFHGKSDTVFYGYSLGIGQGVGVAFGVTVFLLSIAFLTDDVDIPTIAMAAAFIAQELLISSSVGATVGEGVARLRLMEYTSKAAVFSVSCMILWTFVFILDPASYLWI
ncbi:MAG: hypothetical protein ACI4Q9_00475, partial [Candidatus Methanomethylophilaceae archaeon]